MSLEGKNELIMLVDYRNHFYMSVRHKDASMDLNLLAKCFNDLKWKLVIKKYTEIDFRNENYNNKFILYQSSEDRDLFYKNYTEDLLIGLQLQGAILIPKLFYFRAHHNKVFMEILRDLSSINEIKNIRSRYFGTYEDFSRELPHLPSELVFKPSEGCGSNGVKLLKDSSSKRKYAKKIGRSLHLLDALKNIVKYHVRPVYHRKSNYRKKFIVQNYVSGLENDYKILIYGDKYYVLYRHNRKNDFRASGSGIFEYREQLPSGLLDFAERIFHAFDTPYLSLDIGYNDNEYFLIEFQFLLFGNYTLEKAPFFFFKDTGTWTIVRESSVLEKEFVTSVINYLKKTHKL